MQSLHVVDVRLAAAACMHVTAVWARQTRQVPLSLQVCIVTANNLYLYREVRSACSSIRAQLAKRSWCKACLIIAFTGAMICLCAPAVLHHGADAHLWPAAAWGAHAGRHVPGQKRSTACSRKPPSAWMCTASCPGGGCLTPGFATVQAANVLHDAFEEPGRVLWRKVCDGGLRLFARHAATMQKPTWLPSACTLSTARPSAHLHTLNILGAVCLGAAACAGAADTAGLCQAALLLIRQWQEHAAGAGWCRSAAGSGAASMYCRVTRVREAPSDAGECLYSA